MPNRKKYPSLWYNYGSFDDIGWYNEGSKTPKHNTAGGLIFGNAISKLDLK